MESEVFLEWTDYTTHVIGSLLTTKTSWTDHTPWWPGVGGTFCVHVVFHQLQPCLQWILTGFFSFLQRLTGNKIICCSMWVLVFTRKIPSPAYHLNFSWSQGIGCIANIGVHVCRGWNFLCSSQISPYINWVDSPVNMKISSAGIPYSAE